MDPGAEDAIYDSESIRRFVGVELGEEDVPDQSTILRFRHLLERHDLTKAMFAEVGCLLEEKHLLVKSGTIVDATIISAPSSTKNREGKRDPEVRQTEKGNTWYFGMKVHVGMDPKGLVHTVVVTNAAQADINELTHRGTHARLVTEHRMERAGPKVRTPCTTLRPQRRMRHPVRDDIPHPRPKRPT